MTRAIAIIASFSMLNSTALADLKVYNIVIDGLQEVPPVATPGSGQATITLDTVTGDVNVSGTFSALIGTTTAAHVHGLAGPGVNAGVLFALTIDLGASSGTFSGASTLSAPNIQGMLDGLTYINIHSTFRPGGEIRGQIVPAPGAASMLALAGIAACRRRRR